MKLARKCAAAIATVACLCAWGQNVSASPTLTTLVNFNGSNGSEPIAGLAMDAAGNLYGTTELGGSTYSAGFVINHQLVGQYSGDGTVFMLSKANNYALTTLASFNHNVSGSGQFPECSLAFDSAGNVYGTTNEGGSAGSGTVFKVNVASHTLTTLMSFTGSNGSYPQAGLAADAAGQLYGQTVNGGASGNGVLFRVNPQTGVVTTVVSFNGTTDGGGYSQLVTDSFGTIYGPGAADIYKVTQGGATITNLVTYIGQGPLEGIVFDSGGRIYGTLLNGGTNIEGSVFVFDPSNGQTTTLVSFNGSNGRLISGGPIVDAAGNIFGTTRAGGLYDKGTLYEIDAATHALTTLLNFNGSNGYFPYGSLIADDAGNLFGTTAAGGANGFGEVFEVSNAGFVVPEPSSICILGMGAFSLLRRRRR